MSLYPQTLVLVIAVAVGLAGCVREEITHRHVFGVTGGGVGESWLVVEETSGRTDRKYVDVNRYIVYRCLPSGCAAVSVLRGSERRALPGGASSPTTMPTPTKD